MVIFYSPPQKNEGGNDKQTTSQTPPNTSKSLPDASPEKPEIAYKPPSKHMSNTDFVLFRGSF